MSFEEVNVIRGLIVQANNFLSFPPPVKSALKFINSSGASTHGNVRPSAIFSSPSGEWRLGGFEVLSSMKDSQPILYVGSAH